jgi:hypothetical protein
MNLPRWASQSLGLMVIVSQTLTESVWMPASVNQIKEQKTKKPWIKVPLSSSLWIRASVREREAMPWIQAP